MNYSFDSSDHYSPATSTSLSKGKGVQYYFISTILHLLFIFLVSMISPFLSNPLLPPVTEISIIVAGSSLPPPQESKKEVSPSSFRPLIQQMAPPPSPVSSVKRISKDDVLVPPPKVQKSVPKFITKSKPVNSKKVIVGPTVKESDLIAPILETEEFESALKSELKVKTKEMDESIISEDFKKIDQENNLKVASLKNDFLSQANEIENEQENDMKSISSDQKALNDAMISNLNKLRAENQERISSAKNAEKALAAAAAHEQALAAAKAARTKDGKEFGVSGPVRAIEDIRQAPGNIKPKYDNDDRLAKRQGTINFLAYVSSEGQVSQIKLIHGTGHRSLDGKTLMAIKQWKFYPGQEGWVEIPFRWDLKGELQEMPTTLRRQ